MTLISKCYFGLSLMLLAACSGTPMSSSTASFKSGSATQIQKGQDLFVTLNFTAGTQKLRIQAKLQKSAGSEEYTAVKDSITQTSEGEFPEDIAKVIASSALTAKIVPSSANVGEKEIALGLAIEGFRSGNREFAKNELKLTARGTDKKWQKSENALPQYGEFNLDDGDSPSNCKIEPNGRNPVGGVYAVILTNPANCDFKLPKVTVSRDGYGTATVPVGTYWQYPGYASAHDFALTPNSGAERVALDNGFILVQPDGKSYLLADAGVAIPNTPNHKKAATIANDLSMETYKTPTTLLQPDPNTVFKKGSVIAIYDDTPDMAGQIQTNELVQAAVGVGLTLEWQAELK